MTTQRKKQRHQKVTPAPRTLNEFMTEFEASMKALEEVIVSLGLRTPSRNNQDSYSTGRQLVEELILHLAEVVEYLDSLLGTAPSVEERIEELAQQLARAKLAAGDGERFEPAIMAEIRDYSEIYDELRRFVRFRMSGEDRRELELGMRRLLQTREDALGKLGVTIEEVEPGTQLSRAEHQVEKEIATEDKTKDKKICQCSRPGFRWMNAFNQPASRPPQVWVYKFTDAKSEQVPSSAFEEIPSNSFSKPNYPR